MRGLSAAYPHQQILKPKSPLVNLLECMSHQRQPEERKKSLSAKTSETSRRKNLVGTHTKKEEYAVGTWRQEPFWPPLEEEPKQSACQSPFEKALASTKTVFGDALNCSSGWFWAGQTSAVPASQWRKFVSTPSSMGCASSNNSTMVLNRGIPTMLKKPSCKRNTFFRYEETSYWKHTKQSSPRVRYAHRQWCTSPMCEALFTT